MSGGVGKGPKWTPGCGDFVTREHSLTGIGENHPEVCESLGIVRTKTDGSARRRDRIGMTAVVELEERERTIGAAVVRIELQRATCGVVGSLARKG